jgi:hypothetical protein
MPVGQKKSIVTVQTDLPYEPWGGQSPTCTLRPAHAASRISSNLNGRTKKFGWLQAAATKDSSLSITSTNPATILIPSSVGREIGHVLEQSLV